MLTRVVSQISLQEVPLFLPRLSATSSHSIWRPPIIFNPYQFPQFSFSKTQQSKYLLQFGSCAALGDDSNDRDLRNGANHQQVVAIFFCNHYFWLKQVVAIIFAKLLLVKIGCSLLLLITKGWSPATFGSAESGELIMTTMRSLWRIGTMMMVAIMNSHFSPLMLLKWW